MLVPGSRPGPACRAPMLRLAVVVLDPVAELGEHAPGIAQLVDAHAVALGCVHEPIGEAISISICFLPRAARARGCADGPRAARWRGRHSRSRPPLCSRRRRLGRATSARWL